MAQTGTTQGGTGQQPGLRLQDVETPQQRELINDVTRTIQVCEWCADQCIQKGERHMVECIRLCEDVSELGQTVLALVPRQSRFTGQVLQAFQQAVQACARECGQHRDAHCQDCAQVLGKTSESIRQFQQSTLQRGGMGA
jgi:alkylhydroperoxidase family enzyme